MLRDDQTNQIKLGRQWAKIWLRPLSLCYRKPSLNRTCFFICALSIRSLAERQLERAIENVPAEVRSVPNPICFVQTEELTSKKSERHEWDQQAMYMRFVSSEPLFCTFCLCWPPEQANNAEATLGMTTAVAALNIYMRDESSILWAIAQTP